MLRSKVFIVEDHEALRQSLAALIERHPELEVCGVAGCVASALLHGPQSGAQLAVIDLSLPDGSGLDLVDALAKRCPDMRCLVLSGYASAAYAEKAFALGARGYLVKSSATELNTALEEIAAGRTFLSKELRDQLPSRNRGNHRDDRPENERADNG